MAASSVYSHKELQNKNGAEKQEMLFKKGINFNDYPTFFKRGSYIQRKTHTIFIDESNVDQFAKNEKARENLLKQREIKRHSLEVCDFPPFSKIKNKVDVMFNQAEVEYFE